MPNLDRAPKTANFRTADVLALAACFGLVTGMVEGTLLLFFQKLHWLSWNMSLHGVSPEFIWLAALMNLVLFEAAGLLVIGVARLFPRIDVMRSAVFFFCLLMFLDWLATSGRIRHSGVLVLSLGLSTISTRALVRHREMALRFQRKSLPWLAGVFALLLLSIQGEKALAEFRAVKSLGPVPSGAPNILLIVVDTLRADHLSSYHYTRETSPNMDRLAQEGALFEKAIAPSPWTLPSHASLLTGLYAREHGSDRGRFVGQHMTLAKALQARGYRTGAFSANNLFFSRGQGFDQEFIHFEDYYHSLEDVFARGIFGRKLNWFLLRRLGYEDYPGRRRAASVNDALLQWVRKDPNKPFFAMLNYFDPHEPYLPALPYRGKYSTQKEPGGLVNGWMADIRGVHTTMPPEQAQGEIDAYDGAVAYTDEMIGRLLDAIQGLGITQKTLVVVTSDHGEQFGEHKWFGHRHSLYRQEIHVPLIFWYPERIPRGVRVDKPVSIAGLPATLLELVGGNNSREFAGPSLVPLWLPDRPSGDWPEPLAEFTLYGTGNTKKVALQSLVSERWHFIQGGADGPELYDWEKDPLEVHNLAATPEGRDIVEQFLRKLEKSLARKAETNGTRKRGD